jgi:hypothetical protein
MNFCFLSFFIHLWILIFVFRCELIDSNELFVLGRSKLLSLSNVYARYIFFFNDLYALRVLSCMYHQLSFLSHNRSLCSVYQLSTNHIIDSQLRFYISSAISFSSTFAWSLGFFVKYLLITSLKWYIQNWVGILPNHHSSHCLPSHTIPITFHHLLSKYFIQSLYTWFVSVFTKHRYRFFLLLGALSRLLNIVTHRLLQKYVVSIIIITSSGSISSQKNIKLKLI